VRRKGLEEDEEIEREEIRDIYLFYVPLVGPVKALDS
jgi:hypothetical protein